MALTPHERNKFARYQCYRADGEKVQPKSLQFAPIGPRVTRNLGCNTQ